MSSNPAQENPQAVFYAQVYAKGEKSKHHIVPTSRNGEKNKNNTVKVLRKLHETYHHLFINRTPEEILGFLVDYFWGGDESFVYRFLEKREKERADSTSVN